MGAELEYTASPRVREAIAALGRTEDVRFSPSNRRLAVAAFLRDRIVVFDIDPDPPFVALTGGVELSSPALRGPHGVDFVDDDTLIVTNRGGDVVLFELPPGEKDLASHALLPIARWPAGRATHLNAPGSVVVTRVEEGVGEVLICNNNGHTVTRHRLDRRAGGALQTSEVLLRKHLAIPDGVHMSPDRRWVAVSNHSTHHVLLYETSPALSGDAEPDGILRGVHYPHGLRFTADGRHLIVADAGAPYLHVFAPDSDGWRGVRHPVVAVRIMDDALFERGRHNPEEGGPKGLDVDRSSRVVVVTSEFQPLAFLDLASLLRHAGGDGSIRERRTQAIGYELSLMREMRGLAEQASQARALQNSMSWWITAPLRRLKATFRRPTARAARPAGARRRGSPLP